MANNIELRGKVVRCLISPDKGSVLTVGAIDNILALIEAEATRREQALLDELVSQLQDPTNVEFYDKTTDKLMDLDEWLAKRQAAKGEQ